MSHKTLLTSQAFWAAYQGLTSVYLTAFALAMGANNIIIGVLGALPWLASIVTQIPGAELVQHFARKNVIILFSITSQLFWLPLFGAPFLLHEPIWTIIIFFLIIKLFDTITEPSMTSLIADVVDEKDRGNFTSARFRILGLFSMVAMTLGGLWLKQFPKESPTGFAIMFCFGALLGVVSSMLIKKVEEPQYADHTHHTIKEFFMLKGPLARFVIFTVFFNFGFMLASPLIAVYMLKDLNISYTYYGIVSSFSVLAQILTSRYIGNLTDKFGDKPIAILGHFGIGIVPILYLCINTSNLWLLLPVQVISGIVWAAADISRFNLLLDLTEPTKRAMQIAEYNLYSNIPMIIAPILGGWMSENVSFILAGIPFVFVLSAILRAISPVFLLGIKEPRAKHEYPLIYVFRQALSIHPNRGIEQSIHVVKRIATGAFK